MPTGAQGVSVFVKVAAMAPVCSEGSGAGGGREAVASEGRFVGLERGTNDENFCMVLFF